MHWAFDRRSAHFSVALRGVRVTRPDGKTEDIGVLLETKSGKYSLRVNHYETSNVNAI